MHELHNNGLDDQCSFENRALALETDIMECKFVCGDMLLDHMLAVLHVNRILNDTFIIPLCYNNCYSKPSYNYIVIKLQKPIFH